MDRATSQLHEMDPFKKITRWARLAHICNLGSKYLIVFYCVVAQTLPLSETLGDLLGVEIRIHIWVESQVPVYLWKGLRTVHESLPLGAALPRTETALVVNRA